MKLLKDPEAPIIVEQEIRRMRKTLNWHIAACLSILVLIVGGWSRAEVRISNNTKDNEYTRQNALNRKAFISHVEAQETYEASISRLITNDEVRAVVEDFNKKMKEINDKIDASQTEIVPRGAGEKERGNKND